MADNGEGCDILYLDYSKTFDTVPHERLLKSWRQWVLLEKFELDWQFSAL